MNIKNLISILCVLLQSSFIYSSNYSCTDFINSDTLYSWADGGLNLRNSNDFNSSIIGSIPYGHAMIFISRDSHTHHVQFYEASSRDTFINGSLFRCIDYLQEGQWTKVKYGNLIGYVFSGYISRYEPGEDESILNCIKRNANLIEKYQIYDTIGDRTTKHFSFQEGIRVDVEITNSTSWMYMFPGMSLEEAMLLARKQIAGKMKGFTKNQIVCLNEIIGNKKDGRVRYEFSNNTNWSMSIT